MFMNFRSRTKMASKWDSGSSEKDIMELSVLYCSLKGVMEATQLSLYRDDTILDVKKRFTNSVDWRNILGDSTTDSSIAKNFMLGEKLFLRIF